jgi:hypothetical protein
MHELTWTADWLWSLPLIALTLAIHSMGLVVIAAVSLRIGYSRFAKPESSSAKLGFDASLLIALTGTALATLHGLEASLWAQVYLGLGAFGDFREAILFSVDSMTTRGASGLSPAPHWALMGALQAACGVLTFGASTAFLFTVMQTVWRGMRLSFHMPEIADDGRKS